MKYRFVPLLAALSLITFTLTSHAGVEPSPFKPEINQLWAVENSLNSSLDRVQKVLAMPPNELPSPNLNGAVNRLEAIDGQVNSLDDFVANTINSVMGVEPSPFRTDLIPALGTVGDVSQAIANAIGFFIENQSESGNPDFIAALENIMSSADYLTGTVDLGIAELSNGGGGDCVITEYDKVTCEDDLRSGCEWITLDTPNELSYCCCDPVI